MTTVTIPLDVVFVVLGALLLGLFATSTATKWYSDRWGSPFPGILYIVIGGLAGGTMFLLGLIHGFWVGVT